MPLKHHRLKSCLRGSLLTILTLAAVVAGFLTALTLKSIKSKWSKREIMYVKFVGDLFLNILKALMLPLIFSSLVSAIGTIDISLSKRIGLRACVYYLTTTFCAVTLGLVLVTIVGPGKGVKLQEHVSCQTKENGTMTVDNLLDILRNMFPPNLVEATMSSTVTRVMSTSHDPILTLQTVPGMNLMGILVFAAALGIALGKMGDTGKPVLDFFTSLAEAMMTMAGKVIWLSPIMIFTLLAGQLLEQENVIEVFQIIWKFVLTVWAGLFIHALVVLPTIYYICTHSNPYVYIGNMTQALATAFGTSSSSATLPVTINCLETKNHVDPRVSRFVLPIGATINMDGLALLLPVSVVFMAQLCAGGEDVSIEKMVMIALVSVTTSIGAAGIGGMGMVILVTATDAVGIPGDYVPYVMSVSWLIGGLPTVVNVLGDTLGAGILNHTCKNELAEIQRVDCQDHGTLSTVNSST